MTNKNLEDELNKHEGNLEDELDRHTDENQKDKDKIAALEARIKELEGKRLDATDEFNFPYKIDDYVKLPKGTYVVEKEIEISETGTLEIEPGTKLLFKENTGIHSKGTLLAKGTEEDKILFTRNNNKKWKNIFFDGAKSSKSRLEYCEISKGGGREFDDNICGGGLLLYNSNASIIETLLNNCEAHVGGGMYITYSEPNIENNIIEENFAIKSGGGIYLWSSDPFMKDNLIQYNTAENEGGGMHLGNSNPNMENNIIKNNSAKGDGGGINLMRSFPNLINNTIEKNSARTGGGMRFWYSDPEMRDNFVKENSAIESGGGIYLNELGHNYNPLMNDNIIEKNSPNNISDLLKKIK